MTIKNKLILMLSIPLIALAIVSAVGFREQSALAEISEDAQANAESIVLLDRLASQLGIERLDLASGSAPSAVYVIAQESDALIEEIRLSGNAEAAAVANAVDEIIPPVRAVPTPELLNAYVDALEVIEISNANKSLVGFTPDGVISVQALQLAREASLSREAAWFSFFALEDAAIASQAEMLAGDSDLADGELDGDEAEATPIDDMTLAAFDTVEAFEVTTEFANANNLSNLAARSQLNNGARFFDVPTSSEAAIDLARLEGRASDSMASNAISNVDRDAVFAALEDNRLEWDEAIIGSGEFLVADTVSGVLQTEDRRSLFTLLALLGGLLLFTLIFVIGRSIIGPMNRLMDHAALMTTERLPFAVAKLRSLGASDELPDLRPIPKESNDEIGALVDSFNEVQETAVRVATDQARSRRNVAEMFVSLGRRNQQLNHRMLSLISDLERDEQSPEVLNGLYQLDHLATRMRRNAESLLVLAGNRAPRQWSRPVPMEDIVRSALAEVEHFERIEVGDLPDNVMHGNAVADVTHLLAELLDNATQFSEPSTIVTVSAHETIGGVEIEVFDEGFGVNEKDLAELNERITNPPALDEAPSRLLGLFVVGRLAQQHDIHVNLQSQPGVGTVATISLPSVMFPTEIFDRSSVVAPPTGAISPPLMDGAEINELREDLAGMASIDTGDDAPADLPARAVAGIETSASSHDDALADASIPTMDEVFDAMPSFPGVTIDEPVIAPPADSEVPATDTHSLAALDAMSDFSASAPPAVEQDSGPEPVEIADTADTGPEAVEIADTADTADTPAFDPFSVAPPLDPFSLAPPLDGAAQVDESTQSEVAEAPVAPPVVEAPPVPPVAEAPVAPPVVEAPPVPPVAEAAPAPPVVQASEPALPSPPVMSAPTEPVVTPPKAGSDTFGGLPTRSPQAALDAVDAAPAVIPLDGAAPADQEAKPAAPSAFAAFAFGVNRGLNEAKDAATPQFSNEGDNS